LSVFAGPSAGFLYAWPLGALVVGLLTEAFWRRFNLAKALVATLAGGIATVYAIGIPFISVFTDTSLATAFTGSLAFVPGDVVKAVVAALVAVAVRRAYPVIDRPRWVSTTP
jgi:biotin transport system substrate-specific component